MIFYYRWYFSVSLLQRDGYFTFNDVLNDVSEKIVRRHPHVFGDATAENEEEALARWNSIKAQEKISSKQQSILDNVPNAFPALLRSTEIQNCVQRLDLIGNELEPVFAKVEEELKELRDEVNQTPCNQERIEEEIGIYFCDSQICLVTLNVTQKRLYVRRIINLNNVFAKLKERH